MISKAQLKDLKSVYELGKELHQNFENLYHLEEMIKKEYFHILVYKNKDKVLGFLMYTELEDTIDILDIVVDKNYRNQKIASNLLDILITNSKINSKIYLEVSVDNDIAIKMYDKFGFNIIHTRKKYYGNKDAYIMERINYEK